MARIARSLETLRRQVDSRWPNRSKASDGWIGDRAHRARKSDHNPNSRGVVQALDITHDPGNGPDAGQLAEALLASRDNRIKYIISNRRIASGAGGPSPWVWRNYRGSNPHARHVHVSVANPTQLYDDPRPWSAAGASVSQPAAASGSAVELRVVQEQLKRLNYAVGDVDGIYGSLTRAALLAFQADNHLPQTGIADAATVEALSPAPPRPLDMERVTATAAILSALGSRTIKQADRTKLVALISSALGVLGLGNSFITQAANTARSVGTSSPLISPEASRAIMRLKEMVSPNVLARNKDLSALFDQANNFQARTVFDLMPSGFTSGTMPHTMSEALATAASSFVPGFGGSLTMLGIGLAAHYFGNNVIQSRVHDHATARNTHR